MKSPKQPKETPEQRAARLAEEERIKVAETKANVADTEQRQRWLTSKTRRILRIFGARKALAGQGGQPNLTSLVAAVTAGQGGGAFGGGGFGGGGGGGGYGGRVFTNLV